MVPERDVFSYGAQTRRGFVGRVKFREVGEVFALGCAVYRIISVREVFVFWIGARAVSWEPSIGSGELLRHCHWTKVETVSGAQKDFLASANQRGFVWPIFKWNGLESEDVYTSSSSKNDIKTEENKKEMPAFLLA